ncbi:phage virion morphogenesis protein [Salmonella enterica subsp. enterica]|nr:phage virion morphogenesis protein [Salmonella enterica subsp. enterica serovar Poona]ECD3711284.1 phage virion morphogenesis protein [Salmonella enterica subsp. enterica serovar Poona]ECG6029184.1 phage virion morphogenesis protein [Salmonella enterica subsp. enterica serovar Poona]ECH9318911.1 phage virion morphogenesis protein [Salmonella enterica subsp. enterica serovar Poona]EDV4636614.1 phage virion morphogenesis protein [Salmonella enterica subsp. enterica serovar Poona]
MSTIDAAVVVDVKRLQRVFLELQAMGDDGKRLTRSVAASLLSSSEMAFEQQKEPDGDKWRAWSDPWRDWRTKHGYVPGKILTLHGKLAGEMTTDYGDTYAMIGSNEPYAAIHQWGGLPSMPPGPAGIPARPYMGFDKVAEKEILSLIKKRFEKAVAAS